MLGLVAEERRQAMYLCLGGGCREDAASVRLLVTLVGQTCKETEMGETWNFSGFLVEPPTYGNEPNFTY